MHKKHTFQEGPFEYTIEEIPAGVDPLKFFEQAVHDCPECQALMARGEKPVIVTGDDIPPALRPSGLDRFRRPRWRDLKRRVRR